MIKYLTCFLALALLTATVTAGPASAYKPRTSQHESFRPADFERLAVIVKPVEQQQQQRRFGFAERGQQIQADRMIEQKFMRILIDDGYTLVSRADLDAAMVEKGLDQARMTDEKYTEEASKILHVSALLVVSVDAFKTIPLGGGSGYYSRQQAQQYYQVIASVAARLVKIDDNMVMWTGDLTIDQNITVPDQDSLILSAMAEAVAKAVPPFAIKHAAAATKPVGN